jgi:glycosyltransferase involved in cell wall biosynthesis
VTRLLHVIHYPTFGGPHNEALQLDGPLRTAGVQVTVLLPSETGNALPRLRNAGVEVVAIPLHRLRATLRPRVHLAFLGGFAREVAAIRRLIRVRGIQIVEIAGLVNPHAAIAARLEGVPVVWKILDTRTPWPLSLLAMVMVRSLAASVLSTGRLVALAHPGGSRLGSRLVSYLPPVDVARFTPNRTVRKQIRDEWGVLDGDSVIGAVCNVNPQKGVDTLIQAFAIVHERSARTRLVVAGLQDPRHHGYADLVRREIHRLRLVEGIDVRFLGARADIERVLQGFDIFVMASVAKSEGIPTAMLEAMASGLPVVATDVGGVTEVVDDGVNGFVVRPSAPEPMAKYIGRLVNDDQLGASIGAAARATALTTFSIEDSLAAHIRAYEIALSTKPCRSTGTHRSVKG